MIGQDSKLVLTDEEIENFVPIWGKSLIDQMYDVYLICMSLNNSYLPKYMNEKLFPVDQNNFEVEFFDISEPQDNFGKQIVIKADKK